jgi:hypothetical protein
MVKTWPKQTDHRVPMARISDPAMEWHDVNLNDLLACARRELEFRQRVYPIWIGRGTMSEAKAEREIALQRTLVEFMVHCVFKAVTRQAKAQASAN